MIAAARALVVPTLAVLAVAAFLPGRLSVSVRLYALILCVAVMVVALAALRRMYPPATPLGAARRSARRARPPSLERMGDLVALGVAGSFDLHHRLRPRIRSIAGGLVSARRRVSLDDRPEDARRVLGDEAYDLVRADRPPPQDRLARGMPAGELRRVVEALERV